MLRCYSIAKEPRKVPSCGSLVVVSRHSVGFAAYLVLQLPELLPQGNDCSVSGCACPCAKSLILMLGNFALLAPVIF